MTHTTAKDVASSALRAVLYLRQSKDFSGDMRAIDRQRQANTEYCDRRGWVIVGEYVDNDTSASSKKPRPDFERMMLTAAKPDQTNDEPFDIIVSWQIDRLTRRPIESERFIELYETSGTLFATTSGDIDLTTEQGRFNLRMYVNMARMEVERKSNRQRLADNQRADEGRLPSARSFGYVGRELHELEAPALANAYASLLAGESMVSIAKHLNMQGFRSRKSGTLLTNVTIRKILRNPRNCGYRGLNGEIRGKGDWPAIVERDVWEASILMMNKNKPSHGGIGTARRWVGSGLFICGRCGLDMKAAVNATVSDVSRRRAYRCRSGSHLTRSNAAAIDAFVELAIIDRFDHPDLTSALLDDRSDRIVAVKARLAALDVNRQRINDDRSDGDLDKAEFRRQIARNDAKREELLDELGSYVKHSVLGPIMSSSDPAKHYRSLPVTLRQKVIRSLAVVTLHPAKIGGVRSSTVDASTVEIEWHTAPIE